MNKFFWQTRADQVVSRPIVIDRPQGKTHPQYPESVYPLDYGYVGGTSAADGDGIDVWVGSQEETSLTGKLYTYDTLERDAEIKLLLGCIEEDVQTINNFHGALLAILYIPKPKQ